ncbi:M48 family metallopeptidase [Oscillospiraceae bacterium MB08-C2-2]|nr:M48 family metallopeptidase [Oscillospiraceae bacterium MB08-C2-2]
MNLVNPTDGINTSFPEYVKSRKMLTQAHMQGGVPDYAYGADYVLRQKIKAIPGFYAIAKAITNTTIPLIKQQLNSSSLKVGPSQFPDIYEIVVDCARRLGIGIPAVYIRSKAAELNATAWCVDDDMPLIEITSALLERSTPGELKAVIGHECGHIHNNHGIFNTAAQLILNAAQTAIPGVQQILALVTMPLQLAFSMWSRAGEVTCDRAGVICSEDAGDTISVQSNLLYGAALNCGKADIDALLKQYDAIRDKPVRFLELDSTHPIGVRRIFAVKEFFNSEVLYAWRPEWRMPDMHLVDKQTLDARCEKYISVLKSGKRS